MNIIGIVFCLPGLCFCSFMIGAKLTINTYNEKIGSDFSNISELRDECEASLPRDQECVMVFDFVPVKKEKSE